MKKLPAALLVLACAAALARCGRTLPCPLDASQLQSVEVFTEGVPAAAVRKTVTAEEDIRRIARKLNRIWILCEATGDNGYAGGIGMHFRLNPADGEPITLIIGGNGNLLYADGVQYKILPLALAPLWESLDYEEVKVGEQGLPRISSMDNHREVQQ